MKRKKMSLPCQHEVKKTAEHEGYCTKCGDFLSEEDMEKHGEDTTNQKVATSQTCPKCGSDLFAVEGVRVCRNCGYDSQQAGT
jgi:ribosomal protein S27AE